MVQLKTIKCHNCGKTLLEAAGEGKKICPKCKTLNHFVVTEFGIIYIDKELAPGEVIVKDSSGHVVTRFDMTT